MIILRKSEDRGHFDFGWLNTYHTFSFGDYHDPQHMEFRSLRVINEDRVKPGQGFPTHFHKDMEIITYLLSGALEHRDSLGNGSVIRPGEVQRMSAGTGVTHSEYNPSMTKSAHLLQIWIFPDQKGTKPGYEQKEFSQKKKEGQLRLIASRDGREGSVTIHQKSEIYAALLNSGQQVEHTIHPGHSAWIQVARGKILLGDQPLRAGDGAAISDEKSLTIATEEKTELLLFDLV